jgi:hypothetical protein
VSDSAARTDAELGNEMRRYSHGSIDNLEGREPVLPDDEPYMSGWFAREHSKAWGDHKTMTPGVRHRITLALKAWNEWRVAHGFDTVENLPL